MYYNRFEVAMGQGNHPMLPAVGGHVWFDKRGERTSVYKLSGPERLVDKHGRALRRSMWCWHGEEAQPSGGEDRAGLWCCQGMCPDLEDYQSLAAILQWLRRWRKGDYSSCPRSQGWRETREAGFDERRVW